MAKELMSEIFKYSPTFRLFRREPSFFDGIASLVNMSSNLFRYNQDATEIEADTNSLRADWYAIGEDLWKAIKEYERESRQATAR